VPEMPKSVTWPLLDTGVDSTGWERIGGVDTAERRSMWMRLTHGQGCDQLTHAVCCTVHNPATGEGWYVDDETTVTQIELRAGREGCDSYLKIDRSNPQFAQLLAVFLDARFAVQT
jgi:hypothetical protein